MTEDRFVRGNKRLDRLLADPDRAKAVAEIREDMRQADRTYQLGLASVRKAADLTQVELAERMGVGQNSLSRLEHREDLLLSTLGAYLAAAGGTDARVIVHLNGQDIELPLPRPGAAAAAATTTAAATGTTAPGRAARS